MNEIPIASERMEKARLASLAKRGHKAHLRHTRIRQAKFVREIIKDPTNIARAIRKSGYKDRNSAKRLMKFPQVQQMVEEGLSKAARAAGVSRQYVLERLKENVERCMQREPVLDVLGRPTGVWKFDSGGANRALELIGKHMKLFGDGDDSGIAKIGAAVLRMLTTEAQAERLKEQAVEGEVVPPPPEGTP